MTKPQDQTPIKPPKNPFRVLGVEHRDERKHLPVDINDAAGPRTPLKPFEWQPSISPQPTPKKQWLREMLTRHLETEEDAEMIARTLKQMMLNGNLKAIEFAFNWLEGKAISRSESGKAGEFEKMLDESVDEISVETAQKIVDGQKEKEAG